MDIAAEELLARALAGDADGVVAVLRSMPESDRRACAEAIVDARDPRHPEPVKDALAVAEFGVLPPSKIRRLVGLPVRWHGTEENLLFEEILRLRPRPWRERLLSRANWSLGLPWPVAYRLVRDGLADPPETSWYYAAAVSHVGEWRDDPDWLAGPFWELFTHEEAGRELSRAYGRAELYRELADTGRVPRAHLLAACVHALRRDFASRATHFYRDLFKALNPTVDELHLLSGSLLALLAADNPLDVGLAVDALTALQKQRTLDAHVLLDALPPALVAPAKKHALAAIELAAGVLRAEPSLTGATVEALSECLYHRRADVQRRAFRLIEPHLGLLEEDTVTLVLSAADDLDPAIRTALQAHPDAPRSPLPDPSPAAPQDHGVLAIPTPLSAFGGSDAALLSAARASLSSYLWLHGRDRKFGEALLAKIEGLPAPAGLRAPLYTPTRPGGWIDPAEAARRLWHLIESPSPWDLALMILRLAPDIDHGGRASLAHLDSPEAGVVRYALGETAGRALAPATLAPAWAAAGAVRETEAHERRAREDSAAALKLAAQGRYEPRDETVPLPDDPVAALESYKRPPAGMLPWLATLWPSNHEPIFRMVARWLWQLGPDDEVPELESAVALIADPHVRVGPEAGLTAAVCLSVSDVGLRTFTAETVASAITTRSVSGAWLGRGLVRALLEYRDLHVWHRGDGTAGVVPRRWAEPLREIARASEWHAEAVHTALQILLASVPHTERSRFTDILSLLRHLTLAHQRVVDNVDARRFLRELSPRSQGGEMARDILALPKSGPRT